MSTKLWTWQLKETPDALLMSNLGIYITYKKHVINRKVDTLTVQIGFACGLRFAMANRINLKTATLFRRFRNSCDSSCFSEFFEVFGYFRHRPAAARGTIRTILFDDFIE